MTSEYKGWDNYIRSKTISCGSIGMCKKYPNMRHEFYDECDKAKEHFDTVSKANQYLKIKEEWKGAVDEYFGVEKTEKNNWGVLKDLDKRMYHIKGHVDTLHERINNITDCGHGKLKQMVTPLHQANVIGRIEALEDFRRNHSGEFHVGKDLGHIYASKAIDELQKKVRGLEDNQHKHGHTEILLRIEKLEDNEKAYHESSMTAWNNKHEDRIMKLEERQKATDYGKFLEWQRTALAGGWKAVDKRVWEDIKAQIGNLSTFVYGMSIEKLYDDIRKVDPEWQPDKK